MPNTAPLSERHAGLRFFDGWPVSALRVLRAAHVRHPFEAEGQQSPPLSSWELCWRSKELLGEPMQVGTASQGTRLLSGEVPLSPPLWEFDQDGIRENHRIVVPEVRLVLGTRYHQHPLRFQLNEVGMTLAAISLAHYPPQSDLEQHREKAERPPDPVTPLWKVFGDGTEYLVLAADAAAAMRLVEVEHEGEMAVRAAPIDTSAPLILAKWEQL